MNSMSLISTCLCILSVFAWTASGLPHHGGQWRAYFQNRGRRGGGFRGYRRGGNRGGGNGSSSGACNPGTIENELIENEDKLAAAFSASDFEAATDMFSDDGRIVTGGAPSAIGREQILGNEQFLFRTLGVNGLVVQRESRFCAGDYAIQIGTYQAQKDGVDFATGRDMLVWKKVNGEWKIYLMWNAPDPTEGGNPEGDETTEPPLTDFFTALGG